MNKLTEILEQTIQFKHTNGNLIEIETIVAEQAILDWIDKEIIGSNEHTVVMPVGLGQSFRGDGKPYTEIAIENKLRDRMRKKLGR